MLKKGIYENIINQEVERDIQEAESQQLVCLREQIDAAESPKILADYLAKAIRQKLEDTEDMHDRMTLVNRILAEYGLVEETGRMDAPGRPLLFGTTEEFLRRFSVQSLDELPSLNPEQVEHFKEEAEEEAQLKLDI